jgi:AAA ATPase-like protein
MSQLVGRARERAVLQEAMERASSGSGALLLVAGEAGVGKTALVDHLSTTWGALDLRGVCTQDATAPYGPIVAALRSHLRADPDALAGSVPLLDHLAVLLPELGPADESTNRMTLFEAVRPIYPRSSSVVTARTAFPATMGCAGCATSCGAQDVCTNWCWNRSRPTS